MLSTLPSLSKISIISEGRCSLASCNGANCSSICNEFSWSRKDWQAQIWKVLRKYHNLLDEVEDLHFHFDSFKSTIETNFKHFKEATSQNVQNFQTSLGIQQTYSSTLCTHVNNIYNKLSELQKHIQHHCMYPHQTDTVQINALEYNPDIDGDNQPNTDKRHITVSVQGTLNTSQESSVLEDDSSIAPDNTTSSQN